MNSEINFDVIKNFVMKNILNFADFLIENQFHFPFATNATLLFII